MSLNNDSDIFEKFNDSARNVLVNAQQIVHGTNSPLGSEHILLALSSTKGTLSFDILKEYLISPDQIRLILGATKLSGKKNTSISESGKLVIKNSVLIAAKYNHISVDSEHLLMACLSSSKLLSYKLIGQLGADPEKIKIQLSNLFSDLAEMDEIIRNKISQNTGDIIDDEIIDNTAPITKKRAKQTPALDYFTTDLTAAARKGELDAVVGRNHEINRALNVLARRTKNNPVLVGEPGVGKTAIVEGIAQLIIKNKVPAVLDSKRILMLDLPLLVAGTMYRGQFEERIKKVLDEVTKNNNTILFVDEIHTIVGAGSAEGSIDAASILKPALTRNKLRLIGATTHSEYRKYIEKDSALERRMQKVIVNEPTCEQSIDMIMGLKKRYEDFHNTIISEEVVKYATELSVRYIFDRYLPDKAIDILDETAASVSVKNKPKKSTPNIDKLANELAQVSEDKELALSEMQIDKAYKLRQLEKQLENKISKSKAIKKAAPTHITKEDIALTVAQITGLPYDNIISFERNNLKNIEKTLSNNIVAQDEAITEVTQAIKRYKTGIKEENKPVGSFIFLGPTGVGKTELAKALARHIYGSEKSLIRIDMSEFMERHSMSRLLGAPPGYVGYEEAGKLTEAVRKQPYSILLFDEIEKANPEFFNILLQILDDGFLTDAQGNRVNFRNTLIIMTSNVGLKEYHNKKAIGFTKKDNTDEREYIKRVLSKSLKNYMSPELINRIDRIIVFNSLDGIALKKIVTIELSKLSLRILKKEQIEILFDNKVIDWLAKVGTDTKYGARPLKRAIQNYIENIIADGIIEDQIQAGNKYNITVINNKPKILAKIAKLKSKKK